MIFFKSKNRYSFKQVQYRCAQLGITISKTDYQNNITKYTAISNSYSKKFIHFLSQNQDYKETLYKNLSKSKFLPKCLIEAKAHYILEKKFQRELNSKAYTAPTQTQSPKPQHHTQTISLNDLPYLKKDTVVKPTSTIISNPINVAPTPTPTPTSTRTQNPTPSEATISDKKNILEEKRKNYLLKRQQEKIIQHKQKIQKALKCAILSLPFLGMGSACYLGAANTFSSPKNEKNTLEIKNSQLNNLIVSSASEAAAFSQEQLTFANSEYQETAPIAPRSQQIDNNIPIIQHDVIAQSPNVDFFNYCFNKASNYCNAQNKYGITSQLYTDFIRTNNATACYHKINSYNKLTFNDMRIIAKAQIYDKYGIAHIQNKSLGAYIYNILHYTQKNNSGAKIIAQSIQDFYTNHNKVLPSAQRTSLNQIIDNKNPTSNDWYNLIAAINATSVNPSYEGRLFALIQNRISESGILQDNSYLKNKSNFYYEPTIKVDNIPLSSDVNSFVPTLSDLNYNRDLYAQILQKEKDSELNTFFNIYMQCSYDNYINLKCGYKNAYFSKANASLRNHGINTSIHRRLYCAGMSMASLCQAADIFKQENPNSHINIAINNMLNSCRNVHYCSSLKADLSRSTNSVYRSYNLESDVKNYMQKNKNAILFVWAPRGGGNFHHQTLFPASSASQNDAYTYCAFNRQHWGDETTFSKYMRSRSRYGQGGFFADIEQGLNLLATKSLNISLNRDYALADKELKSKQNSKFSNLYAMNTYQR